MAKKKETKIALPKPECKEGYTRKQLAEILGDRLDAFDRWMDGQTYAICSGIEYDPNTNTTVKTHCGPHGPIYFPYDVERFILKKPIID